jgi:hypothetical protein
MDDESSDARADDVPETPEQTDVAQLAAERDALAAEVESLRRRRSWAATARRLVAPVLVAVFAVSFLAAGVGIWLQRTTLNDEVWAERVVPIGEDPEVQAALAAWTTEQVLTAVDVEGLLRDALPEQAQVLATPLSRAVDDWVGERVDAVFASERFEEIWTAVATQAHEVAVEVLRDERPNIVADDDSITVNLVPLINAVLAEVLDRAPALVGSDADLPEVQVGDLPEEARERLAAALGVELDEDFGTITIDDDGRLSTAQQVVSLLDRFVVLSVLLTIAAAAGAMWASANRRRTLLQLLGATALVAVVTRRATFAIQDQVLELVRVEENRSAASVIVHALTDPFTDAAAVILWVVAIVALVAAVTGPYPWARRVRTTATDASRTVAGTVGERVQDPATARWVVAHADALRIAGWVGGALLLWFVDLSWWTFVVVGGLVAAWQVALSRIAPDDVSAVGGGPPPAAAA